MELQIHELGQLFEAVQLANVLGDGKTFPDCVPKKDLVQIRSDFEEQKNQPGFDLKKFVNENFDLPKTYSTGYISDSAKTARQHIEGLWGVLTRQPEPEKSSLIPLPHPYIVPGGRFREIYYWDSYFTMLGLRVSGKWDMITNMVNNFSHLIDTLGYIPNGNRSYFMGRSQPPFYSLMVKLLSEKKGEKVLVKYLPQLEKEYEFWMRGADELTSAQPALHRVVRLPDASVLNRYWDEHDTPRPEAYREDVELSHQSAQQPGVLFRHVRAAAESGWDFSSRWFRDSSFASIHTTEIIPVDLNCLLVHLEQVLSEACRVIGNSAQATVFLNNATKRKAAIKKYCWDEGRGFFFDYDFVKQKQKEQFTLAAAFPLFFEVASPDQAIAVEKNLEEKFLKPGGLTTTLEKTGQQWDAPNGWAPLQWIAYKGLLNYGFEELAGKIKLNWTTAILKVYQKAGKMTEKYDVWNDHAEASGGEYPNQDGFGWTNGVFLAMVG